ncbi:MAG: putative fatty-acid--CoA ligase [Acidimicrobiales bacterium]|nr:putative fatty-acid--CoA ligase [Acidimicrobiales bacterium]
MTVVETSLLTRIEHAAGSRAGGITFVGSGAPERVEWGRLHEEARATAAALQARGVAPGDHVAILGPTTKALVIAIQATWLAGAAAVVLPLPMRMGSIDEFVAQTRARIRGADSILLLVDAELAAFIEPEAGDPPAVHLDALVGRADAYERPKDDPGALAVLQFTSGATGDPKGVMLPQRAIVANLDAAAEAGRLQDDDVFVSWLPLYHDMGFIGMLTLPMINGNDLVLAPPQEFLASPSRWMEWMSEYGGSVSAGPNFSYALAARSLRRMPQLDLSRWRLALSGAEPVDPATVQAFCEAGARHGLDPLAVYPCFGMAEIAIAGTFPEPMTGLRLDTVDRVALEVEHRAVPASGADTRSLAMLGRAVPGLELRVCDPFSGTVLDDRQAGELEIRGTSVTPGYYKRPDATAASFHDGWLRTGDQAYLVDGELVLCGRIKDMIIVAGRNVFPEDVERAVSGVDGVRAGNVVAFGVEGRRGVETVVVVAETKAEDTSPVRDAVARRVKEAVGLPAHDVVLVSPGTLPKTSSGKLQRSLARTRYLDDELQPA